MLKNAFHDIKKGTSIINKFNNIHGYVDSIEDDFVYVVWNDNTREKIAYVNLLKEVAVINNSDIKQAFNNKENDSTIKNDDIDNVISSMINEQKSEDDEEDLTEAEKALRKYKQDNGVIDDIVPSDSGSRSLKSLKSMKNDLNDFTEDGISLEGSLDELKQNIKHVSASKKVVASKSSMSNLKGLTSPIVYHQSEFAPSMKNMFDDLGWTTLSNTR
jgi:preprotein translocase subunit YajC